MLKTEAGAGCNPTRNIEIYMHLSDAVELMLGSANLSEAEGMLISSVILYWPD